MGDNFVTIRTINRCRRTRDCEWCGEDIRVGEAAVRIAGKWDGDFSSNMMHPECHAAWEHTSEEDSYEPQMMVRGKNQYIIAKMRETKS